MDSENYTALEVDAENSPADPELLLELAHHYILAQRPQRALDIMISAFKCIPGQADLAAAIGGLAVSLGQADTALYYYRIAVGLDPSATVCYHNLGLLYMSRNNFEKAYEAFASILKYEPENAAVHNDLGVVFNCQSKDEQALTAFRQALDYDPRYEKAFTNCVELLFQLGQYETGHKLACEFEINNPANRTLAKNWKSKFLQSKQSDDKTGPKPTCKSFRLNAV